MDLADLENLSKNDFLPLLPQTAACNIKQEFFDPNDAVVGSNSGGSGSGGLAAIVAGDGTEAITAAAAASSDNAGNQHGGSAGSVGSGSNAVEQSIGSLCDSVQKQVSLTRKHATNDGRMKSRRCFNT